MRWALRAATAGLALSAATGALAADDGKGAAPRLECIVEPKQTVVVSAPFSAEVAEVLVERGDFVERGQILAILESSVEKATVAAARARAEGEAELKAADARRRFERSRYKKSVEMKESGVLSVMEDEERQSARLIAEADYERAIENQRLARLDLDRAEALLERRTVRSPVDGVVVRRLLNPGEYADPLELLELAEVDPLRVEVFAPISMWDRVQVDMVGDVRLEAPLDGVHEARVTIVDRVIDAASGKFGVQLELPNPDLRLPAGLKCEVAFREASDPVQAGAASRVPERTRAEDPG